MSGVRFQAVINNITVNKARPRIDDRRGGSGGGFGSRHD
jgi:hypothetical protein